MERRANLARQALEDGDVDGAYRIAAQNFGSAGADYADAEWVAGFIALTRMDDPRRAVGHFTRFQAAVVDADQPRARRLLARARPRARPATRRRPQAAFAHGARRTRRASTASSPPRSWRARRTRGWPAAVATPDWRDGAVHAVLGGAGRLLPAPRRRRRGGRRSSSATPPRTSRRRRARRWRRWRSTSAGRRSASASPRTPPPTGIILPDQYYPLHADRRGGLAGADRVRDGDRPAGVRVRRRGRRAAPARAG